MHIYATYKVTEPITISRHPTPGDNEGPIRLERLGETWELTEWYPRDGSQLGKAGDFYLRLSNFHESLYIVPKQDGEAVALALEPYRISPLRPTILSPLHPPLSRFQALATEIE